MDKHWLLQLTAGHDQAAKGMQDGMRNWMVVDGEGLRKFTDVVCECDDPEVFRMMTDSQILELKNLAKFAISDLLIRIGDREINQP